MAMPNWRGEITLVALLKRAAGLVPASQNLD